jgi:cell wall-associated NlpC family hydrolase
MRALSRRLAAGTLVVAAVVGLVAVPPATADPIADAEAQATQIAASLAKLDTQLTVLSGQVADAQHQLALAHHRAAEGRAALDAARDALNRRHHALTALAVEVYMAGGSSTTGVVGDLDGTAAQAPVRDGFEQSVGQRRAAVLDAATRAEREVSQRADQLAADEHAAARLAAQITGEQAAAQAALTKETALQKQVDAHLARLIAEEETAGTGEADATTPAAARATLAAAVLTKLPPAPNPIAAKAVLLALSKVGSPYTWGGGGPNTFDCSGLVMWAYGQAGVQLAHWTGDQIHSGQVIAMKDLQPGDLVFMWPPGVAGGPPDHVVMYIGNNLIVQAPHVGGFVEVSSIGWWPGAARVAVRLSLPPGG